MIKVELIAASGCSKCVDKRDELKAAAADAAHDQLDWREINVLDEIDYVVSLGVLTLPAIAINGELVFKSLPNANEMKSELLKRLSLSR